MAAIDDYATLQPGLDSPLIHMAVVTPSDTLDLTDVTRSVYIGAAGALKVTTEGGETLTLASGVLAVGVKHDLRLTRIWATGTTATPIVAAW